MVVRVLRTYKQAGNQSVVTANVVFHVIVRASRALEHVNCCEAGRGTMTADARRHHHTRNELQQRVFGAFLSPTILTGSACLIDSASPGGRSIDAILCQISWHVPTSKILLNPKWTRLRKYENFQDLTRYHSDLQCNFTQRKSKAQYSQLSERNRHLRSRL